MKKYRLNINNLDCANCARKLEENLNDCEQLNNVVVNFSTSKISYETDKEIPVNELNKLVQKIEPDCFVSKDDFVKNSNYHLSTFVIGLFFGLMGIYVSLPHLLGYIFTILAYIILLYKPFMTAIKLLFKSKSINENLLIVISCVGAYIIGEVMEGLMVISLYIIGKMLEEKAVHNSRESIRSLVDIKQDYANKKVGRSIEKVSVDAIHIKDKLVIKKGERIPVDGVVIKGETLIDEAALTGESELIEKKKNDSILSGSINMGSLIEIEATSNFSNSTVSKILELVEEATDKKAKTETFVAKVSKVYTPIVLLLAVLVILFLPVVMDITYQDSIYRGLTFLVISCPCAIAISVPLSYFTGIGTCSKNGILIKGSNYLDLLSHINKMVFDKTGTLTSGSFVVEDIQIFDQRYKKDKLIELLCKGELLSSHPIAKSILKLADKKIDSSDVVNYQEIEGGGLSYQIGKYFIKVGNKSVCECNHDAILHMNINGKHVASIIISDGIKENAQTVIEKLKKGGIRTYMFTGDKKEIALNIGEKLGVDEIKYEMLPTDKYNCYEKMITSNSVISFVGDGVNDAPVLRRSDIGISMGGVGTDSAIEASDVVLIRDDLERIPLAISISKYTNFIIKQNLVFAISVKVIILCLSIFGLANMWFAVFADTGVTLLTILNTLRIMYRFKKR